MLARRLLASTALSRGLPPFQDGPPYPGGFRQFGYWTKENGGIFISSASGSFTAITQVESTGRAQGYVGAGSWGYANGTRYRKMSPSMSIVEDLPYAGLSDPTAERQIVEDGIVTMTYNSGRRSYTKRAWDWTAGPTFIVLVHVLQGGLAPGESKQFNFPGSGGLFGSVRGGAFIYLLAPNVALDGTVVRSQANNLGHLVSHGSRLAFRRVLGPGLDPGYPTDTGSYEHIFLMMPAGSDTVVPVTMSSAGLALPAFKADVPPGAESAAIYGSNLFMRILNIAWEVPGGPLLVGHVSSREMRHDGVVLDQEPQISPNFLHKGKFSVSHKDTEFLGRLNANGTVTVLRILSRTSWWYPYGMKPFVGNASAGVVSVSGQVAPDGDPEVFDPTVRVYHPENFNVLGADATYAPSAFYSDDGASFSTPEGTSNTSLARTWRLFATNENTANPPPQAAFNVGRMLYVGQEYDALIFRATHADGTSSLYRFLQNGAVQLMLSGLSVPGVGLPMPRERALILSGNPQIETNSVVGPVPVPRGSINLDLAPGNVSRFRPLWV